MPPRPSDRALRKLVTDLAERPKADVRAILAGLDLAQRARVEQLMAEFAGAPARPAQPALPSINTEGLSLWLASRVSTAAGDAKADDFTMTSRTLVALREAAASVGIERRPAAATSTGLGQVVFDAMSRWLTGPGR